MAEVTCTKRSATGIIGTLAAYIHGMGTIRVRSAMKEVE